MSTSEILVLINGRVIEKSLKLLPTITDEVHGERACFKTIIQRRFANVQKILCIATLETLMSSVVCTSAFFFRG